MSADIDPTHHGKEKCDALHDAGFWWDEVLDVWVNPDKRLAVCAFAVDECNVARLLAFAATPATEQWQILYTLTPAPGLRAQMLEDLERRYSG